jgi:FHS family Na+ dependent glucose MFS transporter 1
MASSAATTLASERTSSLRLTQTAGYFIAFVGLGLFAALTGPTLSGLAAHTRSTLGEVSILFPVRSFGYMVGSLAGGRLYDRVKGHPIIVASFVLMALSIALAPMLQQLWLLVAVFFLASIAEGAVDVGGNTLLVWVHGAKVGPFMNAMHFFFGVGTFITPILVAQVIVSSGDFNWAYWIIGLSVIAPILWHVRVPSPVHPVTESDPDDARSQTRMGLAVLIAVFFFLYVGMELAFGGWIASYAVAIGYGDAAAAAILTSVFWGSFMLGRLISIPLATRMSARTIMIMDFAACAIGIVIFLLGGNSSVTLWLGTLIVGLGMAALFPTMISFAESRMKITGKVTAIFLTGSSLGGMTLPWLIGQLFEPIGPQVMPWLVLIATILTTIAFFVVNYASNRR